MYVPVGRPIRILEDDAGKMLVVSGRLRQLGVERRRPGDWREIQVVVAWFFALN